MKCCGDALGIEVESPELYPSAAKGTTEETRVEAASTKVRGLATKSPTRRGTPKRESKGAGQDGGLNSGGQAGELNNHPGGEVAG